MKAKNSVLFDLDGTLVDSAYELILALNQLLAEYKLPKWDYASSRRFSALGARGLVKLAFDSIPCRRHPGQEVLVAKFLAYYRQILGKYTQLYDHVELTIKNLQQHKIQWGIVTNKIESLTIPLLRKLQLHDRAACIVCGDTTAYRKPSPEPILYALRQLKITGESCIYVGDNQHDVAAAKAANLYALVVSYGYRWEVQSMEDWGADGILHNLLELLPYVQIPLHEL